MNIAQLRVRQELIGNELMDVCCDYPDQIRVVIDELVSLLNDSQLDQVEDLIVNNYSEDFSADDVEQCIIDGNDYKDCVDKMVESMKQS
tara:strand:+ start:123 stop:389 length:267 start_codon:yes stop_codon:yes gene_type:complete